jgi:hypothetical protein
LVLAKHSLDPVECTADLLPYASGIDYDGRHTYYTMSVIDARLQKKEAKFQAAAMIGGVVPARAVLDSRRSDEILKS